MGESSVLLRLGAGSSAPKRGTVELLAAYRDSPWLRAVVKRISTTVAAIQFQVGVSVSQERKTLHNKALQRAPVSERMHLIPKAIDEGSFQPIEDHPLLDLLSDGNPYMLGQQVRALMQTYLELKGESYTILQRNLAGKPSSLWPVPPNWVRQLPTSSAPAYQVMVGSTPMMFPERDVLAIRDPDPANPYVRGSGAAESLGDELDTDEYASEFLKAFFYNGAVPDGVIAIEGLRPEDVPKVKAEWLAEQRGPRKSHQLKFTNGKVSAQMLGHTFKDMEVVELRRFYRDIVVEVFGVPPEAVGIIENSNRATIDAAMTILAMLVTVPRAQLICDYIQAKLVPEFDDRLVVWFKSPVPDDKAAQLEAAKAAPWALTRGEWRKQQGMPDRGDIDDVHMTPIGLLPQRPNELSVYPIPALPPKPGGEEETPADDDDDESEDEEKTGNATRSAPAVIRKDDDRIVGNVLESLRPERLTYELDPIWQDKVREWGDKALYDLGLDVSFNMLNPLVARHLERFSATRIKGLVDKTTRESLRGTLVEGVRAGESIRDLATRVTDVFEVARGYRSIMIARTEVIGSSNFATYSAYDQSGVVERKQLVATQDDRTRDTHVEADGQIVGLHEPFIIGGHEAMHPGGTGVAEEDINCRCTLVAVIGEPKTADQRLAIWKAYDRRALEWERAAIAALGRGFRKQEQEVIAALTSA